MFSTSLRRKKCSAASFALLSISIIGCHRSSAPAKPTLEITQVPPASAGGPEQVESIAGRVLNAKAGEQIVLYAKNESWWVQPLAVQPFTAVAGDQTWKNSTHLGTEYAAVLVEAGYHPGTHIEQLPQVGNGVIAVLTAKGAPIAPTLIKVIHFGGYDWTVRSAPDDRGGEPNLYDPRNAWTDQKGYLHLRIGEQDGRWSCAEVDLTRSLGYGTYRFVVEDTTHFQPSGVLGMFTLDERRDVESRVELDVQLSQWGKLGSKNAQYVVQPYYIPQNVARFSVPSAVSTHSLSWRPGVAAFSSYAGNGESAGARSLYEHVFTSGVPAAGGETVHLGFYDFYHSKSTLRRPQEVVIEKFEYLP